MCTHSDFHLMRKITKYFFLMLSGYQTKYTYIYQTKVKLANNVIISIIKPIPNIIFLNQIFVTLTSTNMENKVGYQLQSLNCKPKCIELPLLCFKVSYLYLDVCLSLNFSICTLHITFAHLLFY